MTRALLLGLRLGAVIVGGLTFAAVIVAVIVAIAGVAP